MSHSVNLKPRRPGPSLWPIGIGYGDRGEGRTPTHDIQQQGMRGIAKFASFLPPWRFLSRLHGRRCRADAALLLLERANLGAVGLAVGLRLPRGFRMPDPKGKRQFSEGDLPGPPQALLHIG